MSTNGRGILYLLKVGHFLHCSLRGMTCQKYTNNSVFLTPEFNEKYRNVLIPGIAKYAIAYHGCWRVDPGCGANGLAAATGWHAATRRLMYTVSHSPHHHRNQHRNRPATMHATETGYSWCRQSITTARLQPTLISSSRLHTAPDI